MVSSKETIEKIKEIIEKYHNALMITALGTSAIKPSELKMLEEAGIDVSKKASMMALAYHHNMLNRDGDPTAPTSVEDMQDQQSAPGVRHEGEAHEYAVEHSEENVKNLITKMKQDVSARIEGIIRDNNQSYKMNALQNLDRTDAADEMVKEATLSQLKRNLRATSSDANRDWSRVVSTEISNIIGIGSTDRIVTDNREKDLDDVYVYRIVKNDAALCKYCRKFYLDSDGSPKVYKLSTLLANGSNYGKKAADWTSVIGATHPRERCSQVLELKPGWEVLPGGKPNFIGREKWEEYIFNKVST